jgi:hypothetical protein
MTHLCPTLAASERQIERQAQTIVILSDRLRAAGLPVEVTPPETERKK